MPSRDELDIGSYFNITKEGTTNEKPLSTIMRLYALFLIWLTHERTNLNL